MAVPAYLAETTSLAGQNQATNYQRTQNEVAKEKEALLEQRRRANNIWGKILPLAGTAAGAGIGALAGNPMIGASIGGQLGQLGGSQITGVPSTAQPMSTAAMALASGTGSYLGGKSSPTAFQDSLGLGGLTPDEYQAYMKRATGG